MNSNFVACQNPVVYAGTRPDNIPGGANSNRLRQFAKRAYKHRQITRKRTRTRVPNVMHGLHALNNKLAVTRARAQATKRRNEREIMNCNVCHVRITNCEFITYKVHSNILKRVRN